MKKELKNTRAQELKKARLRENKSVRWALGFTMIEATIAMVMLAIAAAGILMPFGAAASVQAEGARQVMAANLASELMEIILAEQYDSIIDKYNGFTEAEGKMKDSGGRTRNMLMGEDVGYSGFSRSAVCRAVNVGGANLIAITVVVNYEGQEMTRITTLAGDHK